MTRIAIVGGGNAGTELAKALDAKADVTLIEAKSHYVHAPAMIRAMVDPTILDRALVPYDKLLTRGRVVQAWAESIDAGGVTLASGERVEADYVVVATGSDYAAPFKAQGGDLEGLRAQTAAVHDRLAAADHVAIIGAGAVGTELAGEIAHAMPGKNVTLVSSDATLFPGFPKALGTGLLKRLRSAGVEVVLGARAEGLARTGGPFDGPVRLTDGREIAADLVFPVIGARAVPTLLEGLPGVEKTSANRVKTDGWMRPSELPNLFALGDVADTGDAMTIVAITRQAPWLTKTLTAAMEGKGLDALKPYTPWRKAPILVPLGPEKGNSFLILATFGDWVTRMMKGRDLFLTRYRKTFGQG